MKKMETGTREKVKKKKRKKNELGAQSIPKVVSIEPSSFPFFSAMGSTSRRVGHGRSRRSPSNVFSATFCVALTALIAIASSRATGVVADSSASSSLSTSTSTKRADANADADLLHRLKPRDWGKKNIDAELSSLAPDTPVLVEFYAHWCPTCQRFAPEFEKAAATLLGMSGENNENDGFSIVVARVDCADEAATCVRFGVPHFPFIRFGSASSFLEKQSPEIETFDGARKAKDVAAWGEKMARALLASKKKKKMMAVVDEQQQQQPLPPPPPPLINKENNNKDHAHEGDPPPPPPHATRFDERDVLKATLLAFRYSLESSAAAADADALAATTTTTAATTTSTTTSTLPALSALEDFSRLLSVSHPIPECRRGSGEMLSEIRKALMSSSSPSSSKKEKEKKKAQNVLASLRAVDVCGPKLKEPPAWGACASARADGRGRGYTCGLWTLFHATSVNLPQEQLIGGGGGRGGNNSGGGGASSDAAVEPGRLWASAVRAWVRRFFSCAECAAHFEAMASSEAVGVSGVATADDAVLWAWRAHNRVNARLSAEEEREEEAAVAVAAAAGERGSTSTGDGVHRKVQWPPATLCPRCRSSSIGKRIGTVPIREEEQWDEREVLAFLREFYGGDKVSSTSTSSSSSSSSLGRRVDPGGGKKKKNDNSVSLASLSSSTPSSTSSSSSSTILVILVVFTFVAFGIFAGARAAPARSKKSVL